MKRKQLAKERQERMQHDMGCTSLAELRAHMVKVHGNVLCAWYAFGGVRGKGMGAKDFVRSAKTVGGFIEEPSILFKEMGLKETDIVYLENFAPKEGTLLNTFLKWILGKMDGDMHKAWETLDADKVTFVSREKFVGAVEGLGDFEGDATKVFGVLDANNSGTLTMDELCPETAREHAAGRRPSKER
jgi:hypothetical protein